jgi:phage FluMu protein Com
MAHLWVRQENDWAVLKLELPVYDLSKASPKPGSGPDASPVELMLVDGEWVLISAPGANVHVNGLPIAANIHVLADRDEIIVNQERLYFSKEVLATVEKYSGITVRCPRCKLEIITGERVVRCPACRALHHMELPTKNCWGYAQTCALCPAPTVLGAGYQWTPEEL